MGAIFSPLISLRELIKKIRIGKERYQSRVRLELNGSQPLHLLIVPGAREIEEQR